jgi:hypothetical protein
VKNDNDEDKNRGKDMPGLDDSKSPSQYKDLYRDLKSDFGFFPLILFVAGAILLIFDHGKGWEIEFPFCGYVLAWRGWLGCLLWVIAGVTSVFRKRQ